MSRYPLFEGIIGEGPPYYAPPEPYEVDEFAWSKRSLRDDLRHQGVLAARMTGGSWHVRANGDGTYSGELFGWRMQRPPPPQTAFSNGSEDEAVALALEWARQCTA